MKPIDDSCTGATPNVEHHAEPVAVFVNGERVEGHAWVRVSIEHSRDKPYVGLRSPVPDSATRGPRLERWVAIACCGKCTVIHACLSLHGQRETIVESYHAPMEVFTVLRGLDCGTDYEEIRALSLCDLLESRVLFRDVLPRWEDREREVPPFERFEAADLYPALLDILSHAHSPVGMELAGCLDMEAVEAAGISVSSEELNGYTGDTDVTIRLRVVVGGVHGPGRLRHRVAIDLTRHEISPYGDITGPKELRRFRPDVDPFPFDLEHLWLCDPAVASDDLLRPEAPGYRMGPTPVERSCNTMFFDFEWARRFFSDWDDHPPHARYRDVWGPERRSDED